MYSAHMLSILFCASLFVVGCSEDTSPGDPTDSGGLRDVSDHDATPPPMDVSRDGHHGDVDVADAGNGPDLPPRPERVESITYLREFGSCSLPSCQIELLFSLTGETMLRFQMGNITNQEVITGAELEDLRALVGDDIFVARVRNGFSCPLPDEPADFLVRLRTVHRMPDGRLDTEMTDVTGCYYKDGAPRADGFIDYAESMHTRYYGEL